MVRKKGQQFSNSRAVTVRSLSSLVTVNLRPFNTALNTEGGGDGKQFFHIGLSTLRDGIPFFFLPPLVTSSRYRSSLLSREYFKLRSSCQP